MMRWLLLLLVAAAGLAKAQSPATARALPKATVHLRFANALPDPARVQTGFAGTIALGAAGADRVSSYVTDPALVAGAIALHIQSRALQATVGLTVAPGGFVTVVLQPAGASVVAVSITDYPQHDPRRARLSFYNATADCPIGSLVQASGEPVFTEVPVDGVAARSISPMQATVVAGCAAGQAPQLELGELPAGSLTSVWLMRPAGSLVAFALHDMIPTPGGGS